MIYFYIVGSSEHEGNLDIVRHKNEADRNQSPFGTDLDILNEDHREVVYYLVYPEGIAACTTTEQNLWRG